MIMKNSEKLKEFSAEVQTLTGLVIVLAELTNVFVVLTTIIAVALLYHFGAGVGCLFGIVCLLQYKIILK